MSDKITIEVNFPFWTAYKANLLLLPHSLSLLLPSLIFPSAALLLCILWLSAHKTPTFYEIILLLLLLFFTPIISCINLYFYRRNNKLAEGPFLYTFDAEGMTCSSKISNTSIKWSGILKVRVSKEFIFLFISPSFAQCIPLVDSNRVNATEELLKLIGEHTNYKP